MRTLFLLQLSLCRSLVIFLRKKDRVKIKSDMGAVFGEADKGLPEYNLSMEPVEFELDAPELTADQNSLCDILIMIAKREKVTLEYQARRVSPNYSKTKLEERDKILADVMAEKDIEIYEDILINHVGEIIKGKNPQRKRMGTAHQRNHGTHPNIKWAEV